MLVEEIIQRVQSLYSKGVQSDDSRLTPRHIYNKLTTVRSKLITQQAKKKQKISQWNFQTIPCVELIEADIHECPCIPPIGCTIYRTKEKLPEPMTDLTTHLLQSVTSLDGSIIFSEIEWTEYKYKAANKYTAKKPDYFIRNDYLYVTAKKGVPIVITVTGLWEDPFKAASYPSYCENELTEASCPNPFTVEFPMDADMIDTLIEMTVQELIMLFGQMPEDITNNGRDGRYLPEDRRSK
jgi:hypothetical protein